MNQILPYWFYLYDCRNRFWHKLAGTTVICYGVEPNNLNFLSSTKKIDADYFLETVLQKIKPEIVFIDAPLSLPEALLTKNISGNYLYREADKELGALSPLFLGTYTARAIKLTHLLNFTFYETYPAALLNELNLSHLYSKKHKIPAQELVMELNKLFGSNLNNFANLHYFDAWLCWLSAFRFCNNLHKTYGNKTEGLIII